MAAALRSTIQSLYQQTTQAIAAFQIGIDDFEPHFIHPGSPQQDVGPDFGAHANMNFQIGFAADAKSVFLGSHTTAKAQLAYQNFRFAPRTAVRPTSAP